MSIVLVVTAVPIPEHRAEVIAAFEAAISFGSTMNQASNSMRYTKGATDW